MAEKRVAAIQCLELDALLNPFPCLALLFPTWNPDQNIAEEGYQDPHWAPEDEDGTDELPIAQDEAWEVIRAYFNDKGLVRQQLDSFDEFVMNSMQEVVSESMPVTLIKDVTEEVPNDGDIEVRRRYTIRFGQVYLSKPLIKTDDTHKALFPQEARLRNLTYSSMLYVEMQKLTHDQTRHLDNPDEQTRWEQHGDDQPMEKVFVGRVPIMLRSKFCSLSTLPESQFAEVGECPFDQVRSRANSEHRALRKIPTPFLRLLLGWLLCYQRVGKGHHRSGAHVDQPGLGLPKEPAVNCLLHGRNHFGLGTHGSQGVEALHEDDGERFFASWAFR